MSHCRILLIVLFAWNASTIQGQSFVDISQGPGYGQEVYYNLSTKESVSVDLTSWDIAFRGGTNASIWLNEGTGGGNGELILYAVPGNLSFEDTLFADMAGQRLFNGKTSYAEGAFAAISNPANPFDLGWGVYSPVTNTVAEGPVYLMQKRDSTWIKFKIDKLESGAFIFSSANLDGSNGFTDTVDTRAYDDGRQFIHYSLKNKEVVAAIPPQWDLVFTRYYTKLPDGEGNVLDYLVTGVIQGPGVEVAQVTTMDPDNRNFDPNIDSFSTDLDVIGYDWKSFDLNTFSWSIPDDLLYFVKKESGEVYKLQFIDFEGSQTGVSVFSQTEEGLVSNIRDNRLRERLAIRIFPNPFNRTLRVALDNRSAELDGAHWQIMDATGRIRTSGQYGQVGQGSLTQNLDLEYLPSGSYFFQIITSAGATLSKPVIKK